jgi:hypothetical protein
VSTANFLLSLDWKFNINTKTANLFLFFLFWHFYSDETYVSPNTADRHLFASTRLVLLKNAFLPCHPAPV